MYHCGHLFITILCFVISRVHMIVSSALQYSAWRELVWQYNEISELYDVVMCADWCDLLHIEARKIWHISLSLVSMLALHTLFHVAHDYKINNGDYHYATVNIYSRKCLQLQLFNIYQYSIDLCYLLYLSHAQLV